MLEYSIADISQITGIKPYTLRIWEKRYGIITPNRSDAKFRKYDEDDLQKILSISSLVKRGYKISEVQNLSQEQISEKLGTVFAPEFSQGKINQLMKQAQTFDQQTFDKTLKHQIIESGLESAIQKVIIPFMQDAEKNWITDPKFLCSKQFAYDLIRRRLIVAGDLETRENGKRIMIFSPLRDDGELELLITDYIIKKYGQIPIYCGENVSVVQAKKTFETAQCAKVLMVGRIYDTDEDFSNFVEQFNKKFDKADKAIFHKKSVDFVDQFQDINFICDIDDLKQYLNEP